MKKRYIVILLIFSIYMTSTVSAQNISASNIGTVFQWKVNDCPEVPFEWGWGSGNKWITNTGEKISATITNIYQDDIELRLVIGNLTVTSNDTLAAHELVLGVWGIIEWFPGLFIDINDIPSIIDDAISSAERISGNYLNGTMEVYQNDDIVRFNYTQDDIEFGEPQNTVLTYDKTTGILDRCHTEYSFGVPYIFDIENVPVSNMGYILSVSSISGMIITSIIAFFVVKKR